MLVVGIVIAVMTIFVVSLKSSADGMGGGTSVVGMQIFLIFVYRFSRETKIWSITSGSVVNGH